jgi:hypothetical protein
VTHSLIPAYEWLHRLDMFPGYSIGPYLSNIAKLVTESGAQTLLDYGCGAGRQYTEKRWHDAWGGIMPTLYDPAVPEFSYCRFSQFDGVICTDVLEHVPENELGDVIHDLVRCSRLWCFVSVCCRPAKRNKTLPGGINAHVTIRPPGWWQSMLDASFQGKADLHLAFTP